MASFKRSYRSSRHRSFRVCGAEGWMASASLVLLTLVLTAVLLAARAQQGQAVLLGLAELAA